VQQAKNVPRHITNTLFTPIPRLLRTSRRKRLGHPIPWPFLSLAGFGLLILVGTVLLALPITTESGKGTSLVNAAFTAVSAVTVTGFVVVDTADHWNKIGEATILGLIQLGGLGIMTSATFLMVLVGFRIGIRGRALAREDLGSSGLSSVRRFVLSIVVFTLLIEGAGFGLMYLYFRGEGTTGYAMWQSAFHAVSAFNNSGFDLVGDFKSFTAFSSNYHILLVTAALVILGGIGFAVVANILSVRKLRALSLNTKIVLAGTALLLIAGTGFILGVEHSNSATLGTMSWGEKVLNSFFQSAIARTAGFNTFPTGGLNDSILFFIIVLMFIGAAAGSPGGGIKVNTFAVIASATISSVRGRQGNEAFGRRIPDEQLRKALTLAFMAMTLIVVVTMVMVAVENLRFIHGLFLVVSSFSTVGLSPIDIATLSPAGKAILMAVMFTGKLGIPLLALLLARLDREPLFSYPEERVNLA